eukprot:1313798-Amorphochlora_amoeboformis.AAC.1
MSHGHVTLSCGSCNRPALRKIAKKLVFAPGGYTDSRGHGCIFQRQSLRDEQAKPFPLSTRILDAHPEEV